jgi:hypothetical protein
MERDVNQDGLDYAIVTNEHWNLSDLAAKIIPP